MILMQKKIAVYLNIGSKFGSAVTGDIYLSLLKGFHDSSNSLEHSPPRCLGSCTRRTNRNLILILERISKVLILNESL